MPSVDLILRGGRIVASDGVLAGDVAIEQGRIAAVLPQGEAADAAQTLDVSGKLLFPGLVDAHAHLREPGLTHKEDFVSGTQAAAAGGVTTVLVMPTDEPWTTTPQQLGDKIALAAGKTHVDLAFQAALGREGAEPAELARLGAISFEIFTADVPSQFLHGSLHDVVTAIAATASTGVLVCVSPGDPSILAAVDAPGAADIAAFAASRPPLAEASGLACAILVAATAGVPVHIRQVNSALGIATLRALKPLADISAETTVQNLLFTEADYLRLGAAIKASPPFRQASDVEALRQAVRDGTVDVVATDHAPHSPAEKAAAYDRFADIPGGLPGLQTLLAMMLHLVDEGVLQLQDIARLCAKNPAERFGLGQRKGRIAVGLDADIVVVDPSRSTEVRGADQYTKAAYTPFDGVVVPYGIDRVFLRGQLIARDGKVTGRATGEVLQPERQSVP